MAGRVSLEMVMPLVFRKESGMLIALLCRAPPLRCFFSFEAF
jgi:hypothetical protein